MSTTTSEMVLLEYMRYAARLIFVDIEVSLIKEGDKVAFIAGKNKIIEHGPDAHKKILNHLLTAGVSWLVTTTPKDEEVKNEISPQD